MMDGLKNWQRNYMYSILRILNNSPEPVAFFGLMGSVAAYCVKHGLALIMERREPLGTRFIALTDAGRDALSQGEKP